MALLQFQKIEQTDEQIISNKIQTKLNGLGIKGIRMGVPQIGPVVTGFPILIGDSTPIAKILKSNEDLALACNVEAIDIRRVKNQVVVFVPNKERKIVDFKNALYWYLTTPEIREMELPILLGNDVVGNFKALDLALQPHVLIAGSTGAGKSVFESSIISGLTMMFSERELEIHLVDTKRLDLTLFENLPQVQRIVRDENDWYDLVDSILQKIKDRNLKLESNQCRNIREYNKQGGTMSHVVIIIDELADLIEKDKEARNMIDKEYRRPSVMDSLKRIIQICRASGIHIIACTQRTSADIVTGTVKSNFPTRISLRLPTGIDSRTILGQNGAENLLGCGDMLISQSDSDNLIRYHGPFVQLDDIERIVNQQEDIKRSMGL